MDEDRRISSGWQWFWHYKKIGLYGEQIERYRSLFSDSQIKFFLHEDLNQRPEKVLEDIFSFLDIDSTFKPDTSYTYNKSGTPRNKKMASIINNTIRHLNSQPILKHSIKRMSSYSVRRKFIDGLRNIGLKRDNIPLDAEKHLAEYYRDDVSRLSKTINRDLSVWL